MKRAIALSLLSACNLTPIGTVSPGPHTIGDEKPDVTCPDISHVPIDQAQPVRQDVSIVADVEDAEGAVVAVEVYFKSETAADWLAGRPLVRSDDAWVWAGAIPADAVVGGGVDYYLLAVDDVGNECTFPEDGEHDPLHFRVNAG